MKYEEVKPPAELADYINCFWFLTREYNEVDNGEVLWPDGCHEMIFHFGSRYHVNKKPLEKAFLIGTLSHYHILEAQGNIKLFGVRLKPWGLRAFLNINVKTLKDQFLSLSDIFNKVEIDELENKLHLANFERGIVILKEFMLEKFDKLKIEKDHSFISYLSTIYMNPVDTEVTTVMKNSNYSQRQFERKCSDLVGLSAKKLSKIARFNQVRLKMLFHPTIDLCDCMNEFGYFDYSHFSKDFKECLGITPLEYKKWVANRNELFSTNQNDVVFLQDES
jgi:AraC-like DNA-binding protein